LRGIAFVSITILGFNFYGEDKLNSYFVIPARWNPGASVSIYKKVTAKFEGLLKRAVRILERRKNWLDRPGPNTLWQSLVKSLTGQPV
jgi:hypothetical protein